MGKALKIEIGSKFNNWTVVEKADNTKNGKIQYLCKCSCGAERKIPSSFLKTHKSAVCSNCAHTCLTGVTKYEWTFLDRVENSVNGKPQYLCRCSCGTTKKKESFPIISGKSQSCGCRTKEINRRVQTKHGKRFTREYKIWQGIKRRCFDTTAKEYKNYGGRGITLFDGWLDFPTWYKYVINLPSYAPNKTIDRIENNQGYFPDNIRWSTMKEQSNNKRTNIFLTCEKESHTISEWADIVGIKRKTLTQRRRNGWSDEKIIKTPLR